MSLELFHNIFSSKTNQKIIIFDSDDWGMNRTHSKSHLDKLLKSNLEISLYDHLDGLESYQDLMDLGDLLNSFRNGSFKPFFNFNIILENPDYDKIKKGYFQKYYGIEFQTNYNNSSSNQMILLRKLANENLVSFQFHAKEHLQIFYWFESIQNNIKEVIEAFDLNFYAVKLKNNKYFLKSFLPAYAAFTLYDEEKTYNNFVEGVEKFTEIFKCKPTSFTPCNYIINNSIIKACDKLGIHSISSQRVLAYTKANKTVNKRVFTGTKLTKNVKVNVRNVIFEPSLQYFSDPVDHALNQIALSFLTSTPAIISTHRINYTSRVSLKNKENSLMELKKLLSRIKSKWPDVIFCKPSDLYSI